VRPRVRAFLGFYTTSRALRRLDKFKMACALLQQRSSTLCEVGTSYGCAADSQSMWTAGCRGIFRCGHSMVYCPSDERRENSTRTCTCTTTRHSAVHGWERCPAEAGDLSDPSAFSALVDTRRTKDRDITLLLYGHASSSAIQPAMGDTARAVRFLKAQLGALHTLTGDPDAYLVISPLLTIRGHPDDNVCASVLRPRGICCGWSAAFSEFFDSWQLPPTHPFPLFALRFWVASRVLALGTNVLCARARISL